MKISIKIVFIVVKDNNSSTVVNGGDILIFHFFEALNGISLKHNIFTA